MRLATTFWILFFCALSWSQAFAGTPVEDVEQHGANFATAQRKVVVVVKNGDILSELTTKLEQHGAVVVSDFLSTLFAPRIKVVRVERIDGKDESFLISVNKSKITIAYTSADMLEDALLRFYTLFDAPYGQRMIRGNNIFSYVDTPKNKGNLRRNKVGIVDGVSALVAPTAVQSAIKSQIRSAGKGSDFIFAMSNRHTFRVNFTALTAINATRQTICEGAAYTTPNIESFVKTARDAGGEFVPALDLLSPNEPFENVTGHRIHSVEGMRFVRSMMEQCARDWGVRKICVGTTAGRKTAPQPYIDLIEEIARREGLTLIVL